MQTREKLIFRLNTKVESRIEVSVARKVFFDSFLATFAILGSDDALLHIALLIESDQTSLQRLHNCNDSAFDNRTDRTGWSCQIIGCDHQIMGVKINSLALHVTTNNKRTVALPLERNAPLLISLGG